MGDHMVKDGPRTIDRTNIMCGASGVEQASLALDEKDIRMLDKSRRVEFAFTKLIVRDLERATAFYRAVCEYGEGYTVDATMADRPIRETILARPGGGAELVLLTQLDGAHPSSGNVVTAFNTVDIDAFQARVLAAGGTVIEPIKELSFNGNSMRIAFFDDPEGLLLEVMER